MNPLIIVSLRHQAIYIPDSIIDAKSPAYMLERTGVLLANLHKLGFVVSEPLSKALNQAPKNWQLQVLDSVGDVLGVKKNWTPLVKGWDVPTGESLSDHMITWWVNLVGGEGTRLECGHIIPEGTFPLERYNGCPFCGTQFASNKLDLKNQGSQHRLLELWTDKDVDECLVSLLQAKTALDATQRGTLKTLLSERPLPKVEISMKETQMMVASYLVDIEKPAEAGRFMKSPVDVMRYLWYRQTGFCQLVEPKTIVVRSGRNSRHLQACANNQEQAAEKAKQELKLKYTRVQCKQVAGWLNDIQLSPAVACELMHPKRSMWVRFIRALRLVEYSKKPGYENLAALLKCFHDQSYPVFAGQLEGARKSKDSQALLKLLQTRPGLFARSLFATMLRFGAEDAISSFKEIVDQIPARLVFTLQSISELYFSGEDRSVSPLGGNKKVIPANPLLKNYSAEEIERMKILIEDVCLNVMTRRFSAISTDSKTIYIDPALFKMPVSIGERSETIQDLPVALMGTRFAMQGDTVRLFMQWGNGLPAQHLDMDLSCKIAYPDKEEVCAYHTLTTTGCKHSGDILHIPEMVGTAEYIDIDRKALVKAGATHVVFISNAYSNGNISPGLVLGWMDSKDKMEICQETGVAYDPSCVQHQVKITQSLVKGLVFGVLEVAENEIVWMEMAYGSQVARELNTSSVKSLLGKLDSRMSIGNILTIKAEAQGLQHIDTSEADENYTQKWAMNTAEVTKLLVD